jgi:hypothetical protein
MRPGKYKRGPKSIETGQVVGVFEPPQTETPDSIQPITPISRKRKKFSTLAQNETGQPSKANPIDRGDIDGFFRAET